jgi:uncharacterized membrane protein/predicted DsbA family dithiol-disulfide isomerase
VTDNLHANNKKTTGVKALVAVMLLALTGHGLSAELSVIHYKTHTDPGYHSVCAVSDNVNCESVALSSYSVFAGLPVSVWGIAGYIVIFCLAAAAFFYRKSEPGFLSGILFVTCLAAGTTSAVLGYVSYAKIASICLFCLGTYSINLILAVVSGLNAVRAGAGIIKQTGSDIAAVLRKPLLTVFFVLIGAGPAATAFAVVPEYWKTQGWSEISLPAHGIDKNGNNWIGALNPGTVITEYTDYQCPYCRAAHKRVRKMLNEHKQSVRIVHAHFPLDNKCNSGVPRKFHEFACYFSVAVECAGRQGRFWEMNDAVFSAQEKVKPANVDIDRFVLQLGLNRKQFNRCVKEELPMEKIKRDIAQGAALGIRGTPSFVIDGRIFTGGLSEKQFAE